MMKRFLLSICLVVMCGAYAFAGFGAQISGPSQGSYSTIGAYTPAPPNPYGIGLMPVSQPAFKVTFLIAVTNATVMIANDAGMVVYSVNVTGAAGCNAIISFASLSPGTYTVIAQKQLYTPTDRYTINVW